MSDTTTTATPVSIPTATPEAPAAPFVPAKAMSLAEARAARRVEAPEGTPAPQTETPAPETTVSTDIDDKQLTTFVKINRDLRSANERVKELSAHVEPATKLAQAQKLAAEGKHLDAIRSLGFDFDAAIADALGTTVDKPQEDPELVRLREEVAALKGESDETKKQRTAAQQAEREQGINNIVEQVTTQGKEKFPYLARSPEWVKAALAPADEVYERAVKDKGSALTQAERDAIIIAALEVAEEAKANEAKLFTSTPASNAPKAITPGVKANVTQKRAFQYMSLKEARAARQVNR